MEDGTYTIAVELSGGSGRADVSSPALLFVENGDAYAQIEWSSSHYDYMLVDGEKYLPVNEEGNSVFEIPVLVFDEEMTVIADTTAMSVPHEIAYTLTFYSDTITPQAASSSAAGPVIGVLVFLGLCAGVFMIFRKKGTSGK